MKIFISIICILNRRYIQLKAMRPSETKLIDFKRICYLLPLFLKMTCQLKIKQNTQCSYTFRGPFFSRDIPRLNVFYYWCFCSLNLGAKRNLNHRIIGWSMSARKKKELNERIKAKKIIWNK